MKKSCFKTYHHIENRIFFKIFKDYFNALNSRPETRVTQKNIADFMGVDQKTISLWMNPDKDKKYTKFSTKRQYQILNFFFSQSMKNLGAGMYFLKFPENQANNFDYLGYYTIHQKLEDYLEFPQSFFYLMQNGKILSEVDRFMIDYIDMPKELYLMLMRQFESCLRYTKYLPSIINDYRQEQFLSIFKNGDFSDSFEYYYPEMKQQYDIYKELDFSTFFKILQDIFSGLRAKAEMLIHKKGYSWNTIDNVTILQRQVKAVSEYPFFGTKSEQYHEIQQVLAGFSEWNIPEYEELYKKFINIVENDEIYEKSKKEQFISIDKTVEKLSHITKEEQAFILNHLSAFLDLNFLRDRISFESSIFYPFIKKMLITQNKTSIIREMETEISKYSNGFYLDELVCINTPTYQMIKTAYRKNHDKLQIYLSICKIKERSISYKQDFDFYLADNSENAIRLYQAFDKHTHHSSFPYGATNILEFILAKLCFHAEDWYLWGLIQIGMDINSTMTIQKILDFLETPDEILTLSAKI